MRRLCVLAALVACSGSGGSPADAPPTIADAPVSRCEACARGFFSADCGGDHALPPALGCDAAGDCAWFVGGCAPAEYSLSDCPAGDICCAGNFPYPEGQRPPPPSLEADLWAFGTQPWDDRRAMTVAVAFDAALTEGTHTFTCTGTDPYPSYVGSPCAVGYAAAIRDARLRGGILSFFLGRRTEIAGWVPAVEVDLRLATPTARVCAYRYSDVYGATCSPYAVALCASSGTLVLSARPVDDTAAGALAGRLDVTLGALHLAASF